MREKSTFDKKNQDIFQHPARQNFFYLAFKDWSGNKTKQTLDKPNSLKEGWTA